MSEALDQSELREGYEEVRFGPKSLIVPTDWSTEQFGDVFKRRRESIDDLEDETIKYVGLKHLDSGQLTINGYDEDGRERSSSRVFRKGDVLFGKLRPNLNKAAIAPFSGVCSSDIIPIYAEKDARQQYLPYLMHSKLVRDRVVSTMEGTNLPRTSWEDLEKTLIPFPQLQEQHRIADILSTVDDQIRQSREAIKKLEKLQKGVRQDLLKGINDSSEKRIVRIGPVEYEIPTEWKIFAVEELLASDKKAIRGGPAGSRIKKQDRTNSGYKLYFQENIIRSDFDHRDDYITEEKFHELSDMEPKAGDILVTLTGNVGECAVFPEDAERGIYESNVMRIRVNTDLCIPEYLCDLMDSSKIIDDQVRAMSHGGSRKKLNNKIVKSISVPIPPKDQQKKIVAILSKVESKIELEKAALKEKKELKRGLMQDLLTGKVRVDAD